MSEQAQLVAALVRDINHALTSDKELDRALAKYIEVTHERPAVVRERVKVMNSFELNTFAAGAVEKRERVMAMRREMIIRTRVRQCRGS